MRVTGWILASLAFCATPTFSRPSPQAEVDEALHHLDAKPTTPCAAGLHIWVRADDLRAIDIAEGDARLVNNLTLLAHDEDLLARCRVQSWTLGLRHRERVALKYPAPDIQLPAEPQYNYTWDEDMAGLGRHGLGRSGQADEDFGVETVINPHTAEKLAYDKELEEYARAIRKHDHWIVHEKERHNFEALWPMGDVERPREHVQVVWSTPFAVAVPPVVFAPKINSRSSTQGAGTVNVTYTQELDLAYVAYVTMGDGEVIEVSAGQTTFIPPTSWPLKTADSGGEDKTFHFDANTDVMRIFHYDDEERDLSPKQIKLANLNLTMTLHNVPTFVQGDKLLLNGTMVFNGSLYELDSAELKIVQHVRPTWAAQTLQADERAPPSLQNELYSTAGLDDFFVLPQAHGRFGSWSRTSGSHTVPNVVADWLKSQDFDRGRFGGGSFYGDDGCHWHCKATLLRPFGENSTITTLQTWANFSSSAAFTTLEAAFETVEAAILIDVTIREHIAEDVVDNAAGHVLSHSEQILQDETSQWGTNDDNGALLLRDNRPARKGKKYQIKTALEGLKVIPREVPIKKRNNALEKRLEEYKADHMACLQIPVSHLSPLARAPIFVDPAKSTEAVSQLCTPSAFPHLNATVISRERRPGTSQTDSTVRFVRNRWHHKRILSHDVKRKEEQYDSWSSRSGTAGKDVGKLWAERVLAPMIKAEKQEAGQGLLGGIKQTVFS